MRGSRLFAAMLTMLAVCLCVAPCRAQENPDTYLAKAGFKAVRGVSAAGLAVDELSGYEFDFLSAERPCSLIYFWVVSQSGARQSLLDAQSFLRLFAGPGLPAMLVVDSGGAEALADLMPMLGTNLSYASDATLGLRLGVSRAPALAILSANGELRALRYGPPDFKSRDLKKAVDLLMKESVQAISANSRETPSLATATPKAAAASQSGPTPRPSPAARSASASAFAVSPSATAKAVAVDEGGFALNAGLADASFASELEKEVSRELNAVRRDPAGYAAVLREFRSRFKGKLVERPGQVSIMTNEGTKAVDEAMRVLESQAPLGALSLSRGMSLACADHALDQGRTGATGHYGSDGSDPFRRMNRYGAWQRSAGENIAYGTETAREIVVQLIVDDGVPSRGHRTNILSRDFAVVGVAVRPHPVWGVSCVMDFAGAYAEGGR